MTIINYGSFSFDTDKVPVASLEAMLRRGFGHYMGSECASKVSTAFAEGKSPEGFSYGEGKAYVSEDDARAAYKNDVQITAMKVFLAGEVGSGATRGPKLDPIDAAFASIVKREVTDKLKTLGLKFPKGDEQIKFADGATRTGEEMLANWGKNHGERIRKEAEKHVKELERKRQKMEAETKAATGQGAADAGL